MFKERKTFIVGALAVLAVFWLMLVNTFIGNCVRANFENGGVLNTINLVLTGAGVGFAIFFFVKNKFEVNDSVVALVAVTSVVYVLLSIIASVSNAINSISLYKDNLEVYKELQALSSYDYSEQIKNVEQNISTNVISLIFSVIERLAVLALVVFSNEPKKTFGKVVGFFKGLFVKKSEAK